MMLGNLVEVSLFHDRMHHGSRLRKCDPAMDHAVSLHFMYYNFCRIHRSLRVTPAMEAGVTDKLWDIEDIVGLLEAKKPN